MGFLPKVCAALSKRGPAYIMEDSTKRASVAVIARITGFPPEAYTVPANSTSSTSSASFLSSDAAQQAGESQCELLYIKRATRAGDPWSGNVAFTGGKRDPADESDLAVAVRETREEVGLDLSDGACFQYLGRLDDRAVYAKGQRRAGFALCPHVFVQTVPITPPLTLQRAEVAAARWVPVSQLLMPGSIDPFGIKMPFKSVPRVSALPLWMKRVLGIEHAFFPSILLNPSERTPQQREEAEESEAAARIASELSTASPEPQFDSHDDPTQAFQLWGLTLRITSDVLNLAGHPSLAWPVFRLGHPLPNAWVYAVCGAIELWEVAQGARPVAHVRPKHVAWTAAMAAGPIMTSLALLAWASGRWRPSFSFFSLR